MKMFFRKRRVAQNCPKISMLHIYFGFFKDQNTEEISVLIR